MKYISYILVLLTTFSLSSCFTGIESTPKINSSDVIKQKAEDTATPETELAKQMTALPLPEWTAGREYVVTNDRISLVFNSTPKNMLPATGDTICYAGYKKLPSIAATENTLLLFTKKGNNTDTLAYKVERPYSDLASRPYVEIPFTVDLTLIDQVRKTLNGKEMYILTSSWYDLNKQRTVGRKFVKVTVEDVVPGSEEYPISVVFNDSIRTAMAMFSFDISENKRGFASMFSFSDPHNLYPAISDENWAAIQEGKVKIDMTRDECRLSLGAPKDVDYGRSYSSAYEQWTYSNGAYLIFEDGLLKRYRL